MEQTQYYGTGRRKTSVARVWLKPGDGKIVVNTLDVEQYIPRKTLQTIMRQPFEATSTLGRYNVHATVKGGGLAGQAGAIRHGIARSWSKTPLTNQQPFDTTRAASRKRSWHAASSAVSFQAFTIRK